MKTDIVMFVFDYFLWHYLQAPKKYLQIWGNYLRYFVGYLFPVGSLLKTLLAPWKRDVLSYGRGFELKKWLETMVMNQFSRVIGAVIRSIVIVFALFVEFFAFIFGFLGFIFWLGWPFFLASSLVSSVYLLFQPGLVKLATLLIVGFDLVTIFIFWSFYQKSRKKMPQEMSLDEILDQEWADMIWKRLGINPETVPQDVKDRPENYLDNFLTQNKVEKDDFSYIASWITSEEGFKEQKKKFWEKENLFAKEGVGRTWLYGWTVNLDKYSQEMGLRPDSKHLIGRRTEVETIGRILLKSGQSNVLLVGDPGVGKKTLVKEFARLVRQGRTAQGLAWKRVLDLDLNMALSGLNAEGQIKERLIKIFNETAYAGNIILVIDDFHNFVAPEKNVVNVLMQYIQNGSFQLIATTTYDSLHAQIEKNPGLLKYFEKVEIKEPDLAHALMILQDSIGDLEKRSGKLITYQALKEIVKTSDQYIGDVPMPEKAVDLLEETVIYVAGNTTDNFVLPAHVDAVISQKTEIPVGELQATEKEKLLNLEDFLHKRVIDQELAVKEISSAMRRSRLSVAAKNRPMGSFLFLGPTGVGKTETAKALAEAYYGAEGRMLRFDMSEYQGVTSLERMIGSSVTQTPGVLTTAARENPFSLLLLDEVEKADQNILNLFLQVLDEGWLTDALGHKVSFRNMIIIATSNAAGELIRELVQKGSRPDDFKQKILDYIQQNSIFRPEFLNRFDGIILFEPLSSENLLKVSAMQLENLSKRMAAQDYVFRPSQDLIAKIAELGYDPAFGARAMKRVIQDKVEDLIAKKMLKNEIAKKVPFEIKASEI
jgi:ATP-dependent Clp protease ATP-binding subunit ClpA